MGERGTITRLLNGEDRPGEDGLFERVYHELRAIAAARLRPGGPVETTVLVHEAWLKLAGCKWDSRAHFFGAAARAMRQVLVDEARSASSRRRRERGATTIAAPGGTDRVEVLVMDELLRELGENDARAAEVVMLRFFGGLEMSEVAQTLGVSLRTVERDWSHARAWLLARLAEDPGPGGGARA